MTPATPDPLDAAATALEVQADALRAQAAALRALRGAQAPAPTASTPEPLVSRHEIARLLGCSLATLDRLIRDGSVPYLVVGDTKRFDVQAVRAALAARTEGPAPAPRALPTIEAAPSPSGVRRVSAGGARRVS